MSAEASSAGAPAPPEDPIIQYVVLARDLWDSPGGDPPSWTLGSVAAQACHAATACLWTYRDDEAVKAYCGDLDHMRKAVLEVKGEAQLRNLSKKLHDAGIDHKLWVEQPEDFPTALATKPYPKSVVGPHVKKLQLCKAALGGPSS